MTSVDQALPVGPSENENIAALAVHAAILVNSSAYDLAVPQQADKDCCVQVGRVNHANVTGRIVEVLQIRREGREKGG